MATLYKQEPIPSGLPNPRPNLLIFMPDQLRYDALGCFGNKNIRTPNIDAFAARGTKFTNTFLQASVCAQSRCSMFTGRYPHVSGHRSLENLIQGWEPNLFRSLKDSGYHVACLAPRGDTFAPEVTEVSVNEYGFLVEPESVPKFAGGGKAVSEDIWDRLFYKGKREDEVDYDEAVVRSALKWLETPVEKPWVLFLPLIFPHVPFRVEEPYFSMYDRAEMPLPSQVGEKSGYEPRYMARIRKEYGTERATPNVWAEIMATYYGMITRLDDQFGRIIDLLDKTKLWDSTVTMFFTDHGEYLGDHGLIEKWPSGLSDSLVREPLIIGGGGLPSGQTSDVLAEMVDLVPTCFQLCGVGEHFPHNGKSLLPILIEGKTEHKAAAFSEGGFLLSEEPLLEHAPFPYDIKANLQHEDTTLVGKAVSMRTKEWSFIYRLYEPAELYNRIEDIQELHNLAGKQEHLETLRSMEADVLRWLVETGDVLSWARDPRFPTVNLPSPKEQLEKRIQELSKIDGSKDRTGIDRSDLEYVCQ